MTWKDYQIKEQDRSKTKQLARRVILIMIVVSATAYGLSRLSFGYMKLAKTIQGLPLTMNSKTALMNKIVHSLPFDSLQDGPKEVKIYREGKDWTFQTTFDPELQKFIYNKLRQYQVDWAGVSVLDSKTGAVKALVSFSSEEPESNHLSLRATFPAASIFKLVTAGAAVQEKHFNSDSIFTYGGDTRYVQKRFLTIDKGRGMTLGDAFAHSTNAIFAKVGARYLGQELLSQYASAFGFNETMPFEFPVQESIFKNLNMDFVEEGKMAAGLGSATLSPLHASLIAASVINQGQMMKPYSIEKILDQDQATYFQAQPEVWKSPLTGASSMQIQKMMRMTIANGTARKGFRDYRKDSILSALDIGGKTGSLTGKDPEGKNEWFVGYAKSDKETLALGIVIVNKKFWKIKPSELAKSLIRYHFKSVKDAEPKEISGLPVLNHPKKAAL